MVTVGDRARDLRETLRIPDVLRQFAPVVYGSLHGNGAELACPCPKCGGDDRFYVTSDRQSCACRQCHTQRMDVAGLTAWLLDVSMHEAVDVLAGRTPSVARRVVSVSTPCETETPTQFHETGRETQTAEWRENAAQRVRQAHERLLGDTATADAARAYLLSRGLTQPTWEAFAVGYDRQRVPVDGGEYAPAVCWPVTHEESDETVAVRYRFLETQLVQLPNGKDKRLRFTSLSGSVTRGRLFGANLLPLPSFATTRCLVICEGEFNAMSVWQAANVAGVDVLSFGSEAQRTLPAWVLDVASHYAAVVTWIDDADKYDELHRQLPKAKALRSVVTDAGKQDANSLLITGMLGGLIQSARLQVTAGERREAVLWQLWDAARAGELDAGQCAVGRRLAQELGRSASWP